MGRALDSTTATHTGDQALTVAYFLRMDILGDPIVAWTGWGAKATGVGPELSGDPGFDTPGYWSTSGTWSVSGGLAVGAAATGYVFKTGIAGISTGNTYQYSFDLLTRSAGSVRAYVGSTAVFSPAQTIPGSYTGTFVATSGGEFGLNSADGFTGTVANLSIRLVVPGTATGDGALDGQGFDGVTHLIGEINTVQDSVGGSGALEISLPGVDLQSEAMRQVVRDKRRWQFRQAWLWMAFLDDSMNVIGKPFRLKTGRMDQMVVSEDDSSGTGVVKAVVESQQAYASESLNTRYSETKDLDPADTSQDYTAMLANMQPSIGQKTGSTSSGIGGSIGDRIGVSRN